MIRIERAPAFATIQDEGRRGFLAAGVPRSGAMDLPALRTLNALLGNDTGSAAIEWALGGGELVFESSGMFATGGATGMITLEGRAIDPWQAHIARAGERLTIAGPADGRFMYIAFKGGIACERVMGSMSTYVPGGFGGLEGRRLANGDALRAPAPARRQRPQVSDRLPEKLWPPFNRERIRYVPRDGVELTSATIVSSASDRTGYRLETASPAAGGSITSEPVCPGTIQLPPDGQPIVLMADAPTIGGYRIAGAVISADLGALAQLNPGSAALLEPVSVGQAARELGKMMETIAAVREWSLS